MAESIEVRYRFKHAIFLLIFSICSYAYALDPASHPIRQAGQVACPSRDFSEFIKAFSENTEMQAAFTKYPLQQQRLDANAGQSHECSNR